MSHRTHEQNHDGAEAYTPGTESYQSSGESWSYGHGASSSDTVFSSFGTRPDAGDGWTPRDASVTQTYVDPQSHGNAQVYGDAQTYGYAQADGGGQYSGSGQVHGDGQSYGAHSYEARQRSGGNANTNGSPGAYLPPPPPLGTYGRYTTGAAVAGAAAYAVGRAWNTTPTTADSTSHPVGTVSGVDGSSSNTLNDQHPGGGARPVVPAAQRPVTDFSRHSHEELVRMLYAGQPQVVQQAGDSWHELGRGLYDRADELERQLREFAPMWGGGAADKYKAMMADLVVGIRRVADTALVNRDLVHQAGDALSDAQAKMPGVPKVAPVDATVAALANGSLPPATATAIWESAGAAGRASLVQQVQQAQQQSAEATAAHSEAVRIMTALAGNYAATEDAIPEAPDAATPPALRQTPNGPVIEPSHLSSPANTERPTSPPLFSGVYSAGLVAAGAATAGRFARNGRMVGWLTGGRKGSQKGKNGAGADGLDKLGGGKVPGVGGIGGGGIGGGGGGGGIGGSPPVPVGSAELAGSGGTGGSSAVVPAASAVGGAASKGVAGMGGMPFMPMGGMGGEGAGNSRRLPPWLMETEDLWGESVQVCPPVIGEAPPGPRGR